MQETAKRTASEEFDHLREGEEKNYQGLKRVLGPSFELTDSLIDLYDLFLRLSQKPLMKLEDVEKQFPALLHSFHWLKHEAIEGAITLMRGHLTDASNFSRRSIEICAFAAKMYSDKEAAKRWMEAGTSKGARDRYLSTFQAHKLVRELLGKERNDYYENDCFDVHPSFFAVTKRATFTDDYKHMFSYFDLDENDNKQTFFVIKFLNLFVWHGKILEFLADSVMTSSGHFDVATWKTSYNLYVQKLHVERERWRPIVDAHFAEK